MQLQKVIRWFVITALITLSFTCYAQSSQVDNKAFTAQLAKSLSADHLYKYMFLEAVANETVTYTENNITFSIGPNQARLHSGIRSELSIDYPYELGQTVSYRFDLKVADDFKSDKQNRWSLFAQWHDQPNPKRGETWQNFPGNSPMVSLFTESRQGVFGIGIDYGRVYREWIPLSKGQWHSFQFTFLWSNKQDGKLTVVLHDETLFLFTGANMLNDFQHYLKIGLYRHSKIPTRNQISFKALDIQTIK